MAKVVISSFPRIVRKKQYNDFPLNRKGFCYFVDCYDKKGELDWSGACRTKKNALIIANDMKKDKKYKQIIIKKYMKV